MDMKRYICEIDALLNDIRFFSYPIVKFLPSGWMNGWLDGWIPSLLSWKLMPHVRFLDR